MTLIAGSGIFIDLILLVVVSNPSTPEKPLKLTKVCRKMLAALLLCISCAVFFYGVYNEIAHADTHSCASTSAFLISDHEHGDACHSNHQTCSRLSCSHGEFFLAGAQFCWQLFSCSEKFIAIAEYPGNPLLAERLFKPPIACAG